MRDFGFRKTNWLKSVGLAALLAVLFPAHAAEKTTYFHFDALGSPVAASDQAGNVVWKEEYRPYGARIKQAPAAGSNTRWYTGHPHDDDTGLTYMGARFYDPVVGRFMATDPKGFTADNLHSFNRYAYANNNPYKFVDPDGREAFARGLGDLPENPVAGPHTAITAGIIASPLLFTVGGVVVAKEAISHVTGIPVGLKGLLQGLGKGFTRSVARGGIDDLLKAGQQLDRNGLTKAGRALQKHGNRPGSVFPKSTGNAATRNQQGQDILEGILRSNNQTTRPNRFGGKDIFDKNTGRGVRFDADGKTKGFLEP